MAQIQLFDHPIDKHKNWLPKDGIVHYYGKIMALARADEFYHLLMNNIVWEYDEAMFFGKHIITKRKVAWYGDEDFEYTYSNASKNALPWTKELQELKLLSEKHSNEKYNSCLLNLYHTGEEGMAYHSDDEKDLKEHGAIASLSFGAERKFLFKHKQTKETIPLFLEHGSLLVMKGATQDNWMHRLPPTKKVSTPRINLTFRMMEG